jgi:hypothetical protein
VFSINQCWVDITLKKNQFISCRVKPEGVRFNMAEKLHVKKILMIPIGYTLDTNQVSLGEK